jgi:hypothetical protein
MAEIKLNKPLYEEKSTPAAGGGGREARAPRAPRPGTLARGAADLIDLLVLHFAGLLVIRFASDAIIALGEAGPWVGLAVGWLYFALGASYLTGGRTLGKVILQLRTVDVTGPDLALGRAAWRAVAILWPLAVYLVVDRIGQSLDRPDTLSVAPLWGRVAGALVFGWWMGNIFFVALDPHGRALWDRLSGSIVITSDCQPEALGEFMRSAREAASGPAPRRAVTALVAAIVVCLGVFGGVVWLNAQKLRELPEAERRNFEQQKKELYVAGFGQPVPLGPSAETAPADAETSTVHFQYRHTGPLDVAALKRDPEVMDKARVLARVGVAEIRRMMAARAEAIPPELVPKKFRFDVGFASYCDLLFAWDSVEVLTISHTVAMREALAGTAESEAKATDAAEAGTTSGSAVMSGAVAERAGATSGTAAPAATRTTERDMQTTGAALADGASTSSATARMGEAAAPGGSAAPTSSSASRAAVTTASAATPR